MVSTFDNNKIYEKKNITIGDFSFILMTSKTSKTSNEHCNLNHVVSDRYAILTGTNSQKANLWIPFDVIDPATNRSYLIKDIGANAFSNANIEKIYILAKLTNIGRNAFKNCKKLKTVCVPNTIIHTTERPSDRYYQIDILDLWPQYDCKTFEKKNSYITYDCINTDYSVILPETVTCIEDDAFYGCESLKSVSIPDNVERIPYNCFYECKNITKVVFGEKTKYCGINAFKNCINLKKVSFSSSLEEIDQNCFENCKKLLEINLPSSIQIIGARAFGGCSKLEKIKTIGMNTILDTESFIGCKKLKSIISENERTYPAEAFIGCSSNLLKHYGNNLIVSEYSKYLQGLYKKEKIEKSKWFVALIIIGTIIGIALALILWLYIAPFAILFFITFTSVYAAFFILFIIVGVLTNSKISIEDVTMFIAIASLIVSIVVVISKIVS